MEMFVTGVASDIANERPVLILNDSGRQKWLPIWIGPAEASAINIALADLKPERPLTHDLLLNAIVELGYVVRQVEITEFASSTFYARIIVWQPGAGEDRQASKIIDARPSDAVALALRARAPIFVADDVVEQRAVPVELVDEEKDREDFKKFVEGLKPSDFKLRGEGEISDSSAL